MQLHLQSLDDRLQLSYFGPQPRNLQLVRLLRQAPSFPSEDDAILRIFCISLEADLAPCLTTAVLLLTRVPFLQTVDLRYFIDIDTRRTLCAFEWQFVGYFLYG